MCLYILVLIAFHNMLKYKTLSQSHSVSILSAVCVISLWEEKHSPFPSLLTSLALSRSPFSGFLRILNGVTMTTQ